MFLLRLRARLDLSHAVNPDARVSQKAGQAAFLPIGGRGGRYYSSEKVTASTLEYRRPREADVPEHVDQLGQSLFAIFVHVEARIIQKAGAAAQADPAVAHVVRNHLRRAIAIAAECAFEIPAGVVEDIAAAPVDELQQSKHRIAETEPITDRLVDLFRTGDAFLHHARRFVHG